MSVIKAIRTVNARQKFIAESSSYRKRNGLKTVIKRWYIGQSGSQEPECDRQSVGHVPYGRTMGLAVLSDLHGIRIRFQKARRLVESEEVTHVLIAGDLAPSGDPEVQRQNVKESFELLLGARNNPKIFAIPGNDDWKIVETTLHEFPEVVVPIGEVYPIGDSFNIVGYPWVPITPFLVKDYEKWDSDQFPPIPKDPEKREKALINYRINLDGYRSQGEKVYQFSFDSDDRSDNIAADLDHLVSLSNPSRTIYLFHSPPYGFHDFGISGGERIHIGSRAGLRFIEKHEPWLTIHGHSHEAVNVMGGESAFTIGQSLGVSVGAGNDPSLLKGALLDPVSRKFRRFEL